MRCFLFALVALLAGAGAAGLFFFKRDMAELERRLAGSSLITETPYGDVEYAIIGEGPPVLAIHGSGGGFDQGLEIIGPLAEHGFQLIAPSRFGYLGSSFPPGASPELQADAFASLLDRLGLSSVAVLGASAGALSAMQFAIRHPERCRALVLLVPATFSPDRAPNTAPLEGPIATPLLKFVLGSDLVLWAAITLAPETMTRMLLATEPALIEQAGPTEQQKAGEILKHILPVSRRKEGLLLDMRTAGAPPHYELERISCPLLAISAEDDLFGTAQSAAYTAEQAPDGRSVIYPSGGHLLVNRGPEVWGEISAFLGSR
jgi:pimeloyl-ACP methyl ester carboxylesterase